MSRKMGDLKKAGAEMDKFFTASESPAETQRKNDTKAPKKVAEKPNKAVKKVFSFRAEVDTVDSWRVWADAKGMKVDELGEKAITEYIKRHALTDDQRQIYELKMAQKKS